MYAVWDECTFVVFIQPSSLMQNQTRLSQLGSFRLPKPRARQEISEVHQDGLVQLLFFRNMCSLSQPAAHSKMNIDKFYQSVNDSS